MLTKEAAAAAAAEAATTNGRTKTFNPLRDDPTICGAQTFRDTFRNTAVFFVLGPPHGDFRRRQMMRPASFLNVAQRALATPRAGFAGGGSSGGTADNEKDGTNSNAPGSNSSNATAGSSAMGSSRIFLVTDVASLQSHLRTTIDSIRPAKLEMKEKFFAERCRLNLLPPPPKASPSSASAPASTSTSVVEVDRNTVAQRVADALRMWSDGAGIPRGEMDVMMGMLGSLEAVATADGGALGRVPVSDRTKQMVVGFFSSTFATESPPSALGAHRAGDEEERRDDRMDEIERGGGVEMVGTEQLGLAGGWTAGGESGGGFSADGGGFGISDMPSNFAAFQQPPPLPSNLGGDGPRQYGGPGYYSSNAWGNGQQLPPLSGANPGAQSHGW